MYIKIRVQTQNFMIVKMPRGQESALIYTILTLLHLVLLFHGSAMSNIDARFTSAATVYSITLAV